MRFKGPNGIITFTSDFGLFDSYVAEVKGAILAVSPSLTIVDVTHDIPPQDIRNAAFQLTRVAKAFPCGTVHLAVVDPGVGTSRRPVVVESNRHFFVGPDNGLFSWVARKGAVWRAIEVERFVKTPPSRTFHGRDIFGPVAAYLASGKVSLDDIGPVILDPVILPLERPFLGQKTARGVILAVDRFGNLIVNIPGRWLLKRFREGESAIVRIGQRSVSAVFGTYDSGGEFVFHEDSSGLTEVAAPKGHGASLLGARPGMEVTIKWGG